METTLKQNEAKTANGADTHSTTFNSVLDLYFVAGASRSMSDNVIINMFDSALKENSLLTMRLLFWARDVRQGAGERRFFNICLKHLKNSNPELILKNIHLISEFGKWSDMFELITINSNDILTKATIDTIKKGIDVKNGLLAKWMPRKGPLANFFRKQFNYTPKEYRKLIVELSDTVEQDMCAKNWTAIEYSHVPSIAMNKYRTSFIKRDENRFREFIDTVTKGEAKINAGVLYPHQLYQAWYKGQDTKAIEAQWYALPNYLEGSKQRIMPVCDVSASMFSDVAIDMSVALGLYISERNEGAFRDAFITFHEKPEMIYLKGSFSERLTQLRKSPWGGSTNIQATFELLLNKAKKYNLSEEDMPSTLLIISDMEFNSAGRGRTNLEAIREMYEKSGYSMPNLVFWNVRGRMNNNPAKAGEIGIGLVSGASGNTVEAVLQGEDFTPMGLMLRKLDSERYSVITV